MRTILLWAAGAALALTSCGTVTQRAIRRDQVRLSFNRIPNEQCMYRGERGALIFGNYKNRGTTDSILIRRIALRPGSRTRFQQTLYGGISVG